MPNHAACIPLRAFVDQSTIEYLNLALCISSFQKLQFIHKLASPNHLNWL